MVEKNKNYKFNFKHYLIYFWENYKIGLKEQFEYKTNLYIGIFLWISFSITTLIFGKILFDNFGDAINWNFLDYVIFFAFSNFLRDISGLFWYNKQLKYSIFELKKLNFYLNIPGIRFFNYSLSRSFNGTIFFMGEFLIFMVYILYNRNFNIIFLDELLISCFLIILLHISVFYFLDSFSWRFMELGKTLSNKIHWEMDEALVKFPGIFFNQNKFHFILFLLPVYFGSTLIVPLFQGFIPNYFYTQILIIIFLNIFFSIVIFFNWRYGLKNYEAFN